MIDPTFAHALTDYVDLIERATPILRELRRACSGHAQFRATDDDLARALLTVDPDALVTELLEIGEWSVETPEMIVYSTVKPERAP